MDASKYTFGFANKLKMDPEIEASLAAMRMDISYSKLLNASRLMDLGLVQNMEQTAWKFYGSERKIDKITYPRTDDREFPREGKVGDVFTALISLPQVKSMIDELGNNAARFSKEFWESRTTTQKSMMLTGAALVSAAVVAGIATNDEAKWAALRYVEDKNIPIPGVPEVSVMYKRSGDDKSIMISIDVGALLNKHAPKSSFTKFFQ